MLEHFIQMSIHEEIRAAIKEQRLSSGQGIREALTPCTAVACPAGWSEQGTS